ncbi:zinc ribbon domain-containing protein [Fictibacillus sp. WQ 8-8]|uniref:zinc ribbon domain-containing protein n=1 Tax=Fictibacillus sp. WQ 8-8 TaxID=2938788 RepID=UPI00210AB9EB|nr:zinc ribbon domain-containing protein [Fictibacillus sp. WQ 8-8]MCQ6264530.1 zinc ribbon domain-containing protein [Fictibacillus sp. WQ 8-8]
MYCSSCGHLNDPNMNYCAKDGAALNLPKKPNGLFTSRDSRFCSSCGTENDRQQNYCRSCSASLFALTKGKEDLTAITGAARDTLKNTVNSQTLQNVKQTVLNSKKVKFALGGALISFLVVLILSFAINGILNKKVETLLENDEISEFNVGSILSEMGSLGDGVDAPEPDSLVGVTDWILASHMVDSTIHAGIKGSAGEETHSSSADFETKSGVLILLLIPFIGLVAGGYFYAAKNKSEALANRFSAALIIGAVYALVLAILSFFAGFSYNLSVNEEFMKMHLSIDTDYSFWGSLFNGFVIGTLFSFLGTLLHLGAFKTTGHLSSRLSYGEPIHQAASTLVRGVILTTLVLFIVSVIKINDEAAPSEDVPWTAVFVFITQLGLYVWNILNFSTFKFQGTADGDSGSLHLSLFSGAGGTATDNSIVSGFRYAIEETLNLDAYMYLGLLIPVLLFLYAGYRIYLKSQNFNKDLLIFSAVYSVLLTFIITATRLAITVSGDLMNQMSMDDMGGIHFSLGFSFFGTLFASLIFSALLAYAGSYIARLRQH